MMSDSAGVKSEHWESPQPNTIHGLETYRMVCCGLSIMSTYYELQPAYGRDYKTKAEVL